MKPGEEYKIDKTDWPRGPWDDEPDRVEWRSKGTPRLPCLIVRGGIPGSLCGYIGVPPGHPWHGKEYDAIEPDPDCHGGLTYSGKCAGAICHVPVQGESDDVWWLGFDCAHANDYRPATAGRAAKLGFSYDDSDLAAQAQRVAKGQ